MSQSRILQDYLKDGRQRVLWNGSLSRLNIVSYGVRQGSVLGPLIFIILTGDLPRMVTESANTAAQVSTSLYADDTTSLVASGTWEETDEAMNATAASIEEYSINNGLHLNPGKTQTLKRSHTKTQTQVTQSMS